MPWERFDDGSYTALRKRLLCKRNTGARQEFLSVLRSNDDFSRWIQREVAIESGDGLPVLDERLTEAEFERPPEDTERQMFERWGGPPGGVSALAVGENATCVVPADACRSTFWGCVTLRHVQGGVIDASYLAVDGSRQSNGGGGLNRIERALAGRDDGTVDAAVRTALRRMSGLPEARGNRSVYVDCPFARGWWRCLLAREASDAIRSAGGTVALRDLSRVMRKSQEYWERLVMLVVSQNSVLGDSVVRTALIWALAEATAGAERKDLGKAEALRSIGRRIGVRAAWQELAVLPLDRLKRLIEQEILPADTAVVPQAP